MRTSVIGWYVFGVNGGMVPFFKDLEKRPGCGEETCLGPDPPNERKHPSGQTGWT